MPITNIDIEHVPKAIWESISTQLVISSIDSIAVLISLVRNREEIADVLHTNSAYTSDMTRRQISNTIDNMIDSAYYDALMDLYNRYTGQSHLLREGTVTFEFPTRDELAVFLAFFGNAWTIVDAVRHTHLFSVDRDQIATVIDRMLPIATYLALAKLLD